MAVRVAQVERVRGAVVDRDPRRGQALLPGGQGVDREHQHVARARVGPGTAQAVSSIRIASPARSQIERRRPPSSKRRSSGKPSTPGVERGGARAVGDAQRQVVDARGGARPGSRRRSCRRFVERRKPPRRAPRRSGRPRSSARGRRRRRAATSVAHGPRQELEAARPLGRQRLRREPALVQPAQQGAAVRGAVRADVVAARRPSAVTATARGRAERPARALARDLAHVGEQRRGRGRSARAGADEPDRPRGRAVEHDRVLGALRAREQRGLGHERGRHAGRDRGRRRSAGTRAGAARGRAAGRTRCPRGRARRCRGWGSRRARSCTPSRRARIATLSAVSRPEVSRVLSASAKPRARASASASANARPRASSPSTKLQVPFSTPSTARTSRGASVRRSSAITGTAAATAAS